MRHTFTYLLHLKTPVEAAGASYIMRPLHILFLVFLGLTNSINAQLINVGGDNVPELNGTASDTAFHKSADKIAIRKITLLGNKRTKSFIVMREVALKEGNAYTPIEFEKKLRLTKEQLMNTTLFITVAVDTQLLGGNEVDLTVEVKERWYLFPVPYFKVIDRNWNVWINDYKASLDRTNIGLKLTHGNTSGRNDKLNLFIIGGYTQQLSFNYSLPYLDKKLTKGYTTGFGYSRNREVNTITLRDKQVFSKLPDFARQTIKADVGATYRRGSDLRMALRLGYVREKFDTTLVQPTSFPLPIPLPAILPNAELLGNGRSTASYVDLNYSVSLLKADYNPYPLRGYKIDLYAVARVGSGLTMFQIGGNSTTAMEIMKNTFLNFQSAFVYTPNQTQPYYNLKMMGYGALTMQGLENYVVDGTFGAMFRMTPKYQLLNFHIRNFVKNKNYNDIPVRVFLKVYGNIGYVFNSNNNPELENMMPNKLLHTAGFGIDFITIYDVVLKLEYSYNQFGQKGFFIRTASDF